MEQSSESVGLNRAALLNTLDRLAAEQGVVFSSEHYSGTILEPLVRSRLARTEDGYMTMLQLRITDAAALQDISNRLLSVNPDLIIYNEDIFARQIMDLIYSEMRKMGLIMAGLILVLIFIFTRSWKKGLAILLPIVSSIVLTFGLMGYLGIRLNLINCLVIVFIFGLVIDYAVFLVSAFWPEGISGESESFRNRSSSAILLSSLTTMTGLGILVLATHPALHSLGSTALLGIFCGVISVFLLTPVLTGVLTRRQT